MKIINDDSKIYLRNYLFNNSIDSLVTDPPAFISFMGKEWDGFDKLNHISEIFKECFRVLKPGAYGVVWALPRTSHHTAKALEDSGFEIRDIIHHVQGQGFPKSLNIGKAFEKKNNPDLAKKYSGFGAALKPAVEHWILIRKNLSEKTVVDNVEKWGTGGLNIDGCRVGTDKIPQHQRDFTNIHGNQYGPNKIQPVLGVTNYTTGRFPANLTHDGSEEVEREFLEQSEKVGMHKAGNKKSTLMDNSVGNTYTLGVRCYNPDFYKEENSNTASRFFNSLPPDEPLGRFPANLTHDGSEEVEREFLEQSEKMGMHKSGNKNPSVSGHQNQYVGGKIEKHVERKNYNTEEISNTASRFFNSLPDDIDTTFIYTPKASTSERNKGLEKFERKTETEHRFGRYRCKKCKKLRLAPAPCTCGDNAEFERIETNNNSHPTVKSIALMSHLIKLTTPPNGICLDPFMGSGSTGVACAKNGFDFIGIEQNKEYFEIAKARIESSKIIS